MTYCLRLTWYITRKVTEHRYETSLERALAVIGLSPLAEVEMWEES